MGLLKHCQTLYAELREAYDRLEEVEEHLKDNSISQETYYDLYEVEFKYALQMSGAYEDLMYALDKLGRERDGMEFYINRVRTNADKLIYAEVFFDNK